MNTQIREQSDKTVYPFRKTSRIYFATNGWFFEAREGLQGPFSSRREAEAELMLFIRAINSNDCFGLELERGFAKLA